MGHRINNFERSVFSSILKELDKLNVNVATAANVAGDHICVFDAHSDQFLIISYGLQPVWPWEGDRNGLSVTVWTKDHEGQPKTRSYVGDLTPTAIAWFIHAFQAGDRRYLALLENPFVADVRHYVCQIHGRIRRAFWYGRKCLKAYRCC